MGVATYFVVPDRLPVDLTPLHHFKGYINPPKVENVVYEKEQTFSFSMTNTGASSPERESCAQSQVVDAYWTGDEWKIDSHEAFVRGIRYDSLPIQSLILKFGVVRVSAKKEITDCRAQVRFKTLSDALHQTPQTKMYDAGNANWFKVATKMRLLQEDEIHRRLLKEGMKLVDQTLLNPTETLHKREEKDLLLFYMRKDAPNVWLCTDAGAFSVGLSFDGKPARFQLDISMSGQGYPKSTWKFSCSALWDDYTITEI